MTLLMVLSVRVALDGFDVSMRRFGAARFNPSHHELIPAYDAFVPFRAARRARVLRPQRQRRGRLR
jgi:hypothetical protein